MRNRDHCRGGRRSRKRREAILSLLIPAEVIVDVGCGDGRVAEAVGAIGTERRFDLFLRRKAIFKRVVADGLSAFRRVDLAIVTGMGPSKILGILQSGPPLQAAIVHAPERTSELRQRLAEAGWRIEAERLAPEGGRFAEVLRIVPGRESARGFQLWFGPHLPADPLVLPHARRLHRIWSRVERKAPPQSRGSRLARGWLRFLEELMERLEAGDRGDAEPAGKLESDGRSSTGWCGRRFDSFPL